jgi:serine O-acetyltransferase
MFGPVRRRLFRRRPRPSAAPAPPALTQEERASLERHFRETPEGRSELARVFRETPEGRACVERDLKATSEGRASLDEFFRTSAEGHASLEQHFQETPARDAELQRSITTELRRQQPTFLEALRRDTAIYASLMFKPPQLRTGLQLLGAAARLAWENDAFFCLLLYRVRVRLYVHGIPVLPTVLHRLCQVLGQLDIGQNVLIEPGVYIPHGKVVIDGIVRVGGGTTIAPWVTVGLTAAITGPTIGPDVFIGTGAKVLGPISIGAGARIAANAVVLTDVPRGTTVAGAPAKVVRDRSAQPDG